jgi:hypothetical protein
VLDYQETARIAASRGAADPSIAGRPELLDPAILCRSTGTRLEASALDRIS